MQQEEKTTITRNTAVPTDEGLTFPQTLSNHRFYLGKI